MQFLNQILKNDLEILIALAYGLLFGATATAIAAWGQIQSARQAMRFVRRWEDSNDQWYERWNQLRAQGEPEPQPQPVGSWLRARFAFVAGASVVIGRLRQWFPQVVLALARRTTPARPLAIAAYAEPRPTGWVNGIYYGKRWAPDVDHTTEIPKFTEREPISA